MSTSAGDFSPSAFTRSIKPSFTKTVLTCTPVSFVNSSSNGWIRRGSRVVYRLSSCADAPKAKPESVTAPASRAVVKSVRRTGLYRMGGLLRDRRFRAPIIAKGCLGVALSNNNDSQYPKDGACEGTIQRTFDPD